jgi:hypothetical protein
MLIANANVRSFGRGRSRSVNARLTLNLWTGWENRVLDLAGKGR